MSGIYRLLFIVTILFLTLSVSGQASIQNDLDSLAGHLIKNIRSLEREQSYLMTDRSIYRSGETIWLRAFLLRSVSEKISTKSKTLFVDLVNEKDDIIYQLMLNARQQHLDGSIKLADSLPSGYYWMRAYTRHMSLRDTDKIYSRPVYIQNNLFPEHDVANRNPSTTSGIQNVPQVSFLPEGGTTITGANCLVAFRINDPNGNPVAVSGYLKDNRDTITLHFSSNDKGIGKFEFFPHRARRYSAVINWNGKLLTYPLPPNNFNAAQLAVSNTYDGIRKVRVLLEDSIYKKDFVSYIIAIAKDSLCFAGIGKGNYEINIPINRFPNGIATLILADKNFKVLSERSFYVKEGNLSVQATLNKETYRKREKAILDILITGENNQPLSASLFVSIVDSSLTEPADDNALLRTPVISNWELAETKHLTDSEIDILMLMKKAVYNQVMNERDKYIFENETDTTLHIQGRVFDEQGDPAANKIVTLYSEGQHMVFATDTTDIVGRFRFPVSDYQDSARFNMQVSNMNKKIESWKIVLDTITYPKPEGPSYKRTFRINQAIFANRLKLNSNSEIKSIVRLEPVTIKAKPSDASYDESKRVSRTSFLITSRDLDKGAYGSAGNAIRRVPGFRIINGFLVLRRITTDNVDAGSEPIVIMNGVAMFLPPGDVSDASPVLNFLNSIPTRDIEFIEVLRGPEAANYGARGANGAIVINTGNGRKESGKSPDEIKTFYAKGYHNAAPFQIPNYDLKDVTASRQLDVRSTLYSNGNLLTDSVGKVQVTFFNNDIPGIYRVIVKGITRNGEIVYKSFPFQVQ